MTTSFYLILPLALGLACSDSNGSATKATPPTGTPDSGLDEDSGQPVPPSRVYATIITHNEQDSNETCEALYLNEAAWRENWGLTLKFAEAIVDAGGAYDLQTDYQWLNHLEIWEVEEDRALLGGKNLMAHLSTAYPGQVVVDPHNHPSTHNYTDVAYRLSLLDVPDTGIVGGFIFAPAENQDWVKFREPVTGKRFDQETWTARALWGAATHLHQGDDSEASGVWRPAAADAFHTDDPDQTLLNIGMYTSPKFELSGGAGIEDLLTKVRAGDIADGSLLTVSVFFDQCGLTERDVEDVRDLIESHADDVASGDLVWATLPGILDIWETEYASQPTIFNAPD